MNVLLFIFALVSAFALFRLFKYVLFRLGYKDSKYPIVQRVERKQKAKDTSELFLPGSRMGQPELDEAMTQQLQVQSLGKGKNKKEKLPFSRQQLKNAILLEDLLHPKFKDKEHGHQAGSEFRGGDAQ